MTEVNPGLQAPIYLFYSNDAGTKMELVSPSTPLPSVGQFTTPTIKRASFTPSANYSAAGDCFGGLFTITGLTAAKTYLIENLQVFVTASTQPTVSMGHEIFDTNPTASTFTDTNLAVLHVNGIGKVVTSGVISATAQPAQNTTATSYNLIAGTAGRAIVADVSGQIYFALYLGGAQALTSPAAAYYMELRS